MPYTTQQPKQSTHTTNKQNDWRHKQNRPQDTSRHKSTVTTTQDKGAINKAIKHDYTPHLQVLQRPTGQGAFEAGTYTTDPVEIDQIMRQAWDKVYNGNTEDQQQLVDNFCSKYKEYIHEAEPADVQAIDWQDIKWACTHSTQTAGGLDGWTK